MISATRGRGPAGRAVKQGGRRRSKPSNQNLSIELLQKGDTQREIKKGYFGVNTYLEGHALSFPSYAFSMKFLKASIQIKG